MYDGLKLGRCRIRKSYGVRYYGLLSYGSNAASISLMSTISKIFSVAE